mmetsp:Transcript_23573/g.70832  ORF Transcript_23573/g.70832 Transcript_23573/m.70832 type:complete len:678 (+) Transcript_23573:35-2068(+)
MPTLAKVLRELKVEDALLYLDQVKMAFSEKPEIYNEFLDIMKNFKAQELDTPGVIQQVSHLFRGYNKLILGFNTFLPDGYKIELPLDGNDATMTVITPSGVSAPIVSEPLARRDIQKSPKAHQAKCMGDVSAPVEFDHAITYVTTIKKRFAHEPDIYKAFLEILHTYQKEQRSIKDVLEQVSELFADHPDLLKEFTYFLPDAVQEQAKERLSRAVRESELRRLQQAETYSLQGENSPRRRATRGLDPTARTLRRRLNQTNVPESALSQATVGVEQSYSTLEFAEPHAKSEGVIPPSRDHPHASTSSVSKMRRHYFARVKEAFTITSAHATDGWAEFLKCIDLFCQDLLNRVEMLFLVSEIFASNGVSTDFVVELENLVQSRVLCWQHSRVRGYSLKYDGLAKRHAVETPKCKTQSSSYRSLLMPLVRCTGRSGSAGDVLNNAMVLYPYGSKLASSFAHTRKSHHEEILFQCEDEHHELDMMAHSNAVTVCALQSLHNQPKKHSPSLISASHLDLIVYAYGTHGIELLELLYKNPEGTIPTALFRLRELSARLRSRLQSSLPQIWSGQCPKINHQCCYFHHKDKRNNFARHLVEDVISDTKMLPVSYDLQHPLMRQATMGLILDLVEQSVMSSQDKFHARSLCCAFLVPFLKIKRPTSLRSNLDHPAAHDPKDSALLW